MVENFLIGTMQVENFMTHFRKHKNSAVIVGGDRSDVQLVALEGNCPCLVLTGNLYPNDIILTRSEVLSIPIVVVRDDTFTVAPQDGGHPLQPQTARRDQDQAGRAACQLLPGLRLHPGADRALIF